MAGIQVHDGAAWTNVVAPYVYANGWVRPKQVMTWNGTSWERVWPPNAGPAVSLEFSPDRQTYRDGESVTIRAGAVGLAESQLRVEYSYDGGATWQRWVTGRGTWTFREGSNVSFRGVWDGNTSLAPSVSATVTKNGGAAVGTSVRVDGWGFTEAGRQNENTTGWWRIHLSADDGSSPRLYGRLWITRPDGSRAQYWEGWVTDGYYHSVRGFWRGSWNAEWSFGASNGWESADTVNGSWIQQGLDTFWKVHETDARWQAAYSSASDTEPENNVRQGKSGDYSWRSFLGWQAQDLGAPQNVARGPSVTKLELKAGAFMQSGDTSQPRLWNMGLHSFNSPPANGSLGAGVTQALWQSKHPLNGSDAKRPWRDVPWNVGGIIDQINNGTFRGLVTGGKFNGSEGEYAVTLSPWRLRLTWWYQMWRD